MFSVILLDKKDTESTEQECSEDEGRKHDEENRSGKVKALVKNSKQLKKNNVNITKALKTANDRKLKIRAEKKWRTRSCRCGENYVGFNYVY